MHSKPTRHTFWAALAALTLAFVTAFCPAGAAKAAGSSAPGPMQSNPNDNIRPVVDSKHYMLIIDKETEIVSVMTMDGNGEYTVIDRQFVCSSGRTPGRTPLGTFKISTKRRWLNSPNYGVREQYACRFNDYIWTHSTCFYKYDPNTLEVESYLDLGKPVSAGCIRMCVRDAKWVYVNCPGGTVVKVIKSGGPAPICVEPLPELPAGATYDPTDLSVAH